MNGRWSCFNSSNKYSRKRHYWDPSDLSKIYEPARASAMEADYWPSSTVRKAGKSIGYLGGPGAVRSRNGNKKMKLDDLKVSTSGNSNSKIVSKSKRISYETSAVASSTSYFDGYDSDESNDTLETLMVRISGNHDSYGHYQSVLSGVVSSIKAGARANQPQIPVDASVHKVSSIAEESSSSQVTVTDMQLNGMEANKVYDNTTSNEYSVSEGFFDNYLQRKDSITQEDIDDGVASTRDGGSCTPKEDEVFVDNSMSSDDEANPVTSAGANKRRHASNEEGKDDNAVNCETVDTSAESTGDFFTPDSGDMIVDPPVTDSALSEYRKTVLGNIETGVDCTTSVVPAVSDNVTLDDQSTKNVEDCQAIQTSAMSSEEEIATEAQVLIDGDRETSLGLSSAVPMEAGLSPSNGHASPVEAEVQASEDNVSSKEESTEDAMQEEDRASSEAYDDEDAISSINETGSVALSVSQAMECLIEACVSLNALDEIEQSDRSGVVIEAKNTQDGSDGESTVKETLSPNTSVVDLVDPESGGVDPESGEEVLTSVDVVAPVEVNMIAEQDSCIGDEVLHVERESFIGDEILQQDWTFVVPDVASAEVVSRSPISNSEAPSLSSSPVVVENEISSPELPQVIRPTDEDNHVSPELEEQLKALDAFTFDVILQQREVEEEEDGLEGVLNRSERFDSDEQMASSSILITTEEDDAPNVQSNENIVVDSTAPMMMSNHDNHNSEEEDQVVRSVMQIIRRNADRSLHTRQEKDSDCHPIPVQAIGLLDQENSALVNENPSSTIDSETDVDPLYSSSASVTLRIGEFNRRYSRSSFCAWIERVCNLSLPAKEFIWFARDRSYCLIDFPLAEEAQHVIASLKEKSFRPGSRDVVSVSVSEASAVSSAAIAYEQAEDNVSRLADGRSSKRRRRDSEQRLSVSRETEEQITLCEVDATTTSPSHETVAPQTALSLDTLFRRTHAGPPLYWLPVSEELAQAALQRLREAKERLSGLTDQRYNDLYVRPYSSR